MDVSPNCDCHAENDAPIVPNIGMFASFDPVALDKACIDAVKAAEPTQNSQLRDHLNDKNITCTHDHFLDNNPGTSYVDQVNHAKKIGLGNDEYELIKV